MKRGYKAVGLSLAVASLTVGCGTGVGGEARAEKPILERTYRAEGSRWPIECYGPLDDVTARPGDTLQKLVVRETVLIQPDALGKPDIPQSVFVEAAADINGIVNPDEILANATYKLAERCQPQ